MGIDRIDLDLKSKVLLIVSYFKVNEDGNLIKYNQIEKKHSKKEILNSFNSSLKVEYVNKRPEKFREGVLYILHTPAGRPDYIYSYVID